jgi:glucokinase
MAAIHGDFDSLVVAGDIGGTNTNLALVGVNEGRYKILFERHYRTREEASLEEPFGRFLAQARRELPGLEPTGCCISGAGPVVEGRIELTNAPWGIDGPAIARDFSLPVRVINDFTAISYGVLLLDPAKPEQVTRLPHLDGSRPLPREGVKLIVGAGTGLGVGFVAQTGDRIEAFPSEGGHITLPVYDEESRVLQRWLEFKSDFVPGAEAAVSGMGIANLFMFFCERTSGELGERARLILDAPEAERPALIAANAELDPVCEKTMDAFVKLFARVCADLSATFIPRGGVYLAGGIASKNETRFLEGSRFMAMFEKSYREHIREILKSLPVMIVKDYSISLYGAANAALHLG